MRVLDVVQVLERFAPLRYAETWDNVGLLVGDPAADCSRVLCTIDLTAEVFAEARRYGAELIVAYHPPIFKPVSRLVAGSIPFEAARSNVAIYSPHTALDVAAGGTNDVLADAVGMISRQPLVRRPDAETHAKLVVFVPLEKTDAVADAIFAAGGGRIGAYGSCSFRTDGTGTFFGDASTNPAVGSRQTLERVAEQRLEVLVPLTKISDVIQALRTAHPYEEPAFDIVRLAPAPALVGMGRVGPIVPAPVRDVAQRLARSLGLDHVFLAGDGDAMCRSVAVVAGAGGSMLDDALRAKADLFVTGEMRHHDALRAAARGTACATAFHSNTERKTLDVLAARITAECPGVSVQTSTCDKDPFVVLSVNPTPKDHS
jgi:dinuclear metal center YbgI/SA1388 family protein